MTVYHITDTQTPYTLAQLFHQPPPQPQPPLPDDPPPLSSNDPSLGMPALHLTSSTSQSFQQQHWQLHQDWAPKAQAIAEQLRLQLLESGKQAVYQLLKKSIYDALPGMIEEARQARAREAAREAAEAERLRVEAKQAAAAAAAEAARLQAEAEAKARAAAQYATQTSSHT